MLTYQDYIVWNPANVKTYSRSAISTLKPPMRYTLPSDVVSKPAVKVNMPFSTV